MLALAVLVLVPLSRLYIGVHSLDQITYGVVVGLAMSFLYIRGGMREQIKKTIALQKMP